ncbi:hypothetical protein [Mycobacterium sp. OTB74]|jgi:hypothetical protein|uniref:hypothetical protein n=1 Tax=Mycobacterium sp. OTB74 TaxID=1853452 RepID=UPI002476D235|nr:hypothetical protein [Mycobacterium sp. OTB74]MDH6247210.1 hypothetical protein [Mycobacterium sp. OTB74]
MSDQLNRVSTQYRQPAAADLNTRDLEIVASSFLASEFAGDAYINWSIDRRIDGYLRHHGMVHVVNDGDAYNAVLEHILSTIGGQRSGARHRPTGN